MEVRYSTLAFVKVIFITEVMTKMTNFKLGDGCVSRNSTGFK